MKRLSLMQFSINGFVALLLVSAGVLVPQTARADIDRDATPQERARVVEVLQAQGCPVVGDVDYIQGVGFEAEDVRCNDGKEYDVFLDENFNVISKREDRD